MPKMIKAGYEYAGFLYNILEYKDGVKAAVPQRDQHFAASKDVHKRNALSCYESDAAEKLRQKTIIVTAKKPRRRTVDKPIPPVVVVSASRDLDTGRDEMWKQKDGSLIAVCDMSELHVRNALRMVIRKDRLRKAAKAETLAIEFGEIDTWGEGTPE